MTYAASSKCIDKACNLEGFRAAPYQDSGGLWTRGYGERCDEHSPPVTEAEARLSVVNRMTTICRHLEGLLPGLMPHQVDALCLFVDNIGWEAFKASGTAHNLRLHLYSGFASWGQWIHDSAGHVDGGLIDRRDFEIKLFIWGWLA